MSTIHWDVSGDGPSGTYNNADLKIDLCEHLTNMEWCCGYTSTIHNALNPKLYNLGKS